MKEIENQDSDTIYLLANQNDWIELSKTDIDYDHSKGPSSYPCLMTSVWRYNSNGADSFITRFIYPDQAWALIIENGYSQTKEKL